MSYFRPEGREEKQTHFFHHVKGFYVTKCFPSYKAKPPLTAVRHADRWGVLFFHLF
jgi:hypothetical protein